MYETEWWYLGLISDPFKFKLLLSITPDTLQLLEKLSRMKWHEMSNMHARDMSKHGVRKSINSLWYFPCSLYWSRVELLVKGTLGRVWNVLYQLRYIIGLKNRTKTNDDSVALVFSRFASPSCNRTFSSHLAPLFQNESSLKTFHMQMIVICMTINLKAEQIFILVVFAWRLVLTQKLKRTRKYRPVTSSFDWLTVWSAVSFVIN